MALQVSYPGVYVQEIPSGVRTLTGVPTSVAAFIGRTARGPVNVPVVINSYGDFERTFGGLWVDSTVSFAVRDFFLNGGGQAVMVRLFAPTFADEAARQAAFDAAETEAQNAADAIVAAAQGAVDLPVATPADVAQAAQDAVAAGSVATAVALTDVRDAAQAAVAGAVLDAANAAAPVTRARIALAGGLELEAANEGAWGNNLRARVDHDVPGGAGDLFNLSLRDDATGQVEVFRNLSVEATHARRVDLVLANQSTLGRGFGPLPDTRPAANVTLRGQTKERSMKSYLFTTRKLPSPLSFISIHAYF